MQVAQSLHVHDIIGKQRGGTNRQCGNKQSRHGRPAAVVQDEDGDDDVLAHDEGGLAKGAKGEAIAHVVRQRDEVRARLEQVRQKRHALGGLGLEQLEDLRDLDDGRGADDANAQALADGELDALGVFDVDVEQQRLVAGLADDGDAEVPDGSRQVVRDGLDERPDGVHGCGYR